MCDLANPMGDLKASDFATGLFLANQAEQQTDSKDRKLRKIEHELYDSHLLLAAIIQSLGGTLTLNRHHIITIASDAEIERTDTPDAIIFSIVNNPTASASP